MATQLWKAFALPKRFLNNSILYNAVRLSSTANSSYKLATTDDDSTIVVWHPKQEFPYEMTKPLPKSIEHENTSVLKTQLTPELKQIFHKKTEDQAIQELMNITHTTKHRWYPRARDKKAKKTPMDREYL